MYLGRRSSSGMEAIVLHDSLNETQADLFGFLHQNKKYIKIISRTIYYSMKKKNNTMKLLGHRLRRREPAAMKTICIKPFCIIIIISSIIVMILIDYLLSNYHHQLEGVRI